MTIQFNEKEQRYDVMLGSLLYSFHYCMYEAYDAIRDYKRMLKVGCC